MVDNLKNILNNQLRGIYVYGSLVWGDFDHTSSDIDVLVALKDDITPKSFKDLNKLHTLLTTLFPSWDDRIEIAYVPESVLKNFKTQSGKIAAMSPGEPFNIKEAGKDWLINYYMLQNKSLVLYGPPPQSIITPISKNEYIHNVKQQALEWKELVLSTQGSLEYQYYGVLTMCRAFYTLQHGEQVSKLKAGTWMIEKFPSWENLIKRALSRDRLGFVTLQEIDATHKEVTSFVHAIIALIES